MRAPFFLIAAGLEGRDAALLVSLPVVLLVIFRAVVGCLATRALEMGGDGAAGEAAGHFGRDESHVAG